MKENRNLDAREINALLEISKAIASGLYLGDVLRLIVTVTAKVMDSKICSLWILDEKDRKLKLKATQSISEEYLKERSLGLGEGVVGTVALHNRPMAILDVLKEPLYKEKELAKREGLVSMLSVPMCDEGQSHRCDQLLYVLSSFLLKDRRRDAHHRCQSGCDLHRKFRSHGDPRYR